MTQQSLSRMESVSLREVWPDEARDFTPWLAEHITELGDALGISLGIDERESAVGRRRLDILATDINSGHTVIIENQLEDTDGDHLSRLLVYGAGKDAAVVVWIASEFDDEHRQALQWLNERTRTEFFGVAIELWRIDGSRPAPHFRVVVAPNDWRRRKANYQRHVTKRRHRTFWTGLEQKLGLEQTLPRELERSDDAPDWLGISKVAGIYYEVDLDGDAINLHFTLDTTQAFDQLASDKDAIEDKLGKLEWTREWSGQGSYITKRYCRAFSELSDDEWDDVYEWLVDSYRLALDVFSRA